MTDSLFACVTCGSRLVIANTTADCTRCSGSFPLIGAAPDLLTDEHDHDGDHGRALETDFIPDRKPKGAISRHLGARAMWDIAQALDHHVKTLGRPLDVLDVGCGAKLDPRRGSLYSSVLANVTRTYRGIDPSSVCVKVSSKADSGLSNFPIGEVARAAGEKMPLPDDSADSVLIISALDHCADPQRVLYECHRILRDDGVLLIQSGNHHSWVGRLMKRLFPGSMSAREASDHHIQLSVSELTYLLTSADFGQASVQEYGYIALPPQGRVIENIIVMLGRVLGRHRFLRYMERFDLWAAGQFPGYGSRVLVTAHPRR